MRFSNFGCTKTCTSDTGCFRSPSLLRLSRSYPNRRGGPSPFPSSPTPLSPPLGLRTYPETSQEERTEKCLPRSPSFLPLCLGSPVTPQTFLVSGLGPKRNVRDLRHRKRHKGEGRATGSSFLRRRHRCNVPDLCRRTSQGSGGLVTLLGSKGVQELSPLESRSCCSQSIQSTHLGSRLAMTVVLSLGLLLWTRPRSSLFLLLLLGYGVVLFLSLRIRGSPFVLLLQ